MSSPGAFQQTTLWDPYGKWHPAALRWGSHEELYQPLSLPLSKVIDFGTNRKRVCMRLPITVLHHSNLGPILHRFGDIAGFLCSCYSTLILGVFHCSRCTSIPAYVISVPELYRQTTYWRMTTLCIAPRNKKPPYNHLRSFEIRFESAVPIRFKSDGPIQKFQIGHAYPLNVVVKRLNY